MGVNVLKVSRAMRSFRWWSDKVTVKLPEIVLHKAITKSITNNMLELLFTIVGCSIWVRT